MGNTKRSYAAYAPEDIADAKRGTPSASIEPWAASRGLRYEGSAIPGSFSNVLPVWREYLFNVCRGTVATDTFGIVAHELDEVDQDSAGDPRMPGSYFAMRGYAKSRGLLSLIGIDRAPPNEAFAAHSYWLPTTKVAVRVPEATLLPAVTIRSAERFPLLGNPKLDDGGLPGFRMAGSEWIDDELRLAITAAVRPLGELRAPYVALRLDHGVVSVSRNGFVCDPPSLDAMAEVVGRVAHGLRALGRSLVSPAPFLTMLPAPEPARWPAGYRRPDQGEVDVFGRAAAELGMVQEDAVAFHRAQPRCPVPGRALGLVRGELDGPAHPGRIGFFGQGRHTAGTYRSAVMAVARQDAVTPLGGVLDASSDLYVEVADDVAYAWPRHRSVGALEAAATLSAALPALRRLGLVAS